MQDRRNEFTRRAFAGRLLSRVMGLLALSSGLGIRAAGAQPPAPRGHATTQTRRVPVSLSRERLERSPFVYISPLREQGLESRCHAELWYAWLDGAVVVTVAREGWKARALARGLDRARIWVGDHGRWKTWYGGRNEAFREAPHFDARGEQIDDADVFERLLAAYDVKYPDEIDEWRDRMRRGQADGSRVLLRYTPLSG